MASCGNLIETPRGKVMIGELPDDFLRLPIPRSDEAMAPVQNRIENLDRSLLTQIEISMAEARLVKNYGVGRMNLYCRVRIGARVELTKVGQSGKNPRWNHIAQCELLPGVTTLLVEVLDARAFSEDERIAWAHVELPDTVVSGQSVLDQWFDLNGKQGTGAEGQIKMVVSCAPPTHQFVPSVHQQPLPHPMQQPQLQQQQQPYPQPHVQQQQQYPQPHMQQQQQQYPQPHVQQQQQQYPQPPVQQQQPPVQQAQEQQPQVVRISQAELQSLLDMFPSMQKDVVVSVLEASRGDMDTAVTNLLSMCEG